MSLLKVYNIGYILSAEKTSEHNFLLLAEVIPKRIIARNPSESF